MGDPHHGLPVLERGQPSAGASAAMLLLHGRGATAEDIFVDCAPLLDEPGFAFWARGGLMGPPVERRTPGGSLQGTPVFVGCSDRDPHVTADQVRAAGDLFEQAGGEVDFHLYPGMAHIVSADEIAHVRRLMAALTRRDQVERPARS